MSETYTTRTGAEVALSAVEHHHAGAEELRLLPRSHKLRCGWKPERFREAFFASEVHKV